MGQLDGTYSNPAGDKLVIQSNDPQGSITGTLYQKSTGFKMSVNGNYHFSGGSRNDTILAFWAHHNDVTVYQAWAGRTDQSSRVIECNGVQTADKEGNSTLQGPFRR